MDTSVWPSHRASATAAASAPSAPLTRTDPTGWARVWGDEPVLRPTLQRMLLAYALLLGLHGLRAVGLIQGGGVGGGLANGLVMGTLDDLAIPLAFDLLWMTACFALVRSGQTSTWADPSFTQLQVGLALASGLLSYALVPVGRDAALPLLLAMLCVGLLRLSARQMLAMGVAALLAWLVCIWALDLFSAPGIDGQLETEKLLVAALALPGLAWAAHQVAQFKARQAQQQHALQDALARLEALTTRDAQTGLANHHHMHELLTAECKRHSRGGKAFCVAMLDIDHLAEVNAQHGRERGDDVIRQLALLAQAHLRASDVLARWSGEEFLLLMPDTDLDGGKRSLERLREHLYTRWGYYQGGRWVPMNCSVGITRYRSGEALAHMLERTERALRQAQSQGPGQVVSA